MFSCCLPNIPCLVLQFHLEAHIFFLEFGLLLHRLKNIRLALANESKLEMKCFYFIWNYYTKWLMFLLPGHRPLSQALVLMLSPRHSLSGLSSPFGSLQVLSSICSPWSQVTEHGLGTQSLHSRQEHYKGSLYYH